MRLDCNGRGFRNNTHFPMRGKFNDANLFHG